MAGRAGWDPAARHVVPKSLVAESGHVGSSIGGVSIKAAKVAGVGNVLSSQQPRDYILPVRYENSPETWSALSADVRETELLG